MASLTESSLMYMSNDNKEWYDRVYLCRKNNKKDNHECYIFKTMKQAQEKSIFTPKEKEHVIIPICSWIPNIADKLYLDYKLNNK